MPRFYFDIETSAGVTHDSAGVDATDPAAAIEECIGVVLEAIKEGGFDDMRSVAIKDEYQIVIANINVEAIRAARRRASNGESSADLDDTWP